MSNPQSDDPALGPTPLLLCHRNHLSNSGNVFRMSVRNSPSKRPTIRFSNVMRLPSKYTGRGDWTGLRRQRANDQREQAYAILLTTTSGRANLRSTEFMPLLA